MLFTDTDYFKSLSDDDKLLSRRVLDWIELSENKYTAKYSAFLDNHQLEVCKSVLSYMNFINYSFYGGYENASRFVLGVFPPYSDFAVDTDFPIKPVLFSYRTEDELSHRDFLGALMGLQIRRDMIGDILVNNDKCLIFLNESVYNFVINNIRKIGSVGVKISDDISSFDFKNVEDSFKHINGTVSSLRLDCIISLVTKLSREKSSSLIRSGNVKVNCIDINNTSHILKENDIFSARGYGKYIFTSITGMSKKNRYCIEIDKFV